MNGAVAFNFRPLPNGSDKGSIIILICSDKHIILSSIWQASTIYSGG